MKQIKITIDNNEVAVNDSTTLLYVAKSLNIDIPDLCFSKHSNTSMGCMVCAVRDVNKNQMIPSCSSVCVEGMNIDMNSIEVKEFRRKALQLILSEHRGACEAPCYIVCPQNLDIHYLMRLILEGKEKIEFIYDKTICFECQGKCEKACNRKKVDTSINIRDLLFYFGTNQKRESNEIIRKKYNHLLGKLTENDLSELQIKTDEGEKLSDHKKEALRCLQCGCFAKSHCELRELADSYQAKQNIYKLEKATPIRKIKAGKIIFESSKCIKCNRCVSLGKKLNPGKGPVFAYRSQKIMISPPFGKTYEETFSDFEEEYVNECPTGAIEWSTIKNE